MFTQNPERPPETFKVKMNSCKRKTKKKEKKKEESVHIFSHNTREHWSISVLCSSFNSDTCASPSSILHVCPFPPFKFYTRNLNIQLYLQEILNNAQRLKQVPCLVLNKPYKISDKIV